MPYTKTLALLDALILEVEKPSLRATAPAKPPPAPAPAPAPPPAPTAPTSAKPDVAKAKAAANGAPTPKAAEAAKTSDGATVPATEALYQGDTYLFTNEASVLAIEPLVNDTGWVVFLDRTCFHPQGGGQPSDTGTITSIEGGEPFAVAMCKKDPGGAVRHEGSAAAPSFTVGAKVRCVIDGDPRVRNARVHSAGHLIDVAMGMSGMTLKPTKGYHFPNGAYVEYEGKLEAKEREALIPKLQEAMDKLIAEGIKTEVKDVEGQKLDTACPLNALPSDKCMWGTGWVRVVNLGGQGCPCGGTHVNSTKELGKVVVGKVSSKGKVTRVSYSVGDID